MSSEVVVKEVSEFTFGGNCIYKFPHRLVLNVMHMRHQPGFLVVNCHLDSWYVGVGRSMDSAIYDWESKFHGYYQRFEHLGFFTEWEEELYNKMISLFDVDYYKENRLYTKVVTGEVAVSRESDGLFPCSFILQGSKDPQPFPEYMYTDPRLMILEEGDKFKGVFEYKLSDGSLQNVLYIEGLSNET